MKESFIFIVRTLSDLYLLTFLLRFIFQWVRADYYNPFAQFVVKVTNPLVVPARRLLPSVGGVDMPTLVVLVLLEALVTALLIALAGWSVPAPTFLWFTLLRLIHLTLWFYTVAILVYVVLSWVGQASYSPLARLLDQIVEPVLRPARRLLPPIGGLDLSPLLVMILLQAVVIALRLPPLLA
ncbi:MAG TPA: YggT family protein [Gammaproteobacteria bacterium]